MPKEHDYLIFFMQYIIKNSKLQTGKSIEKLSYTTGIKNDKYKLKEIIKESELKFL